MKKIFALLALLSTTACKMPGQQGTNGEKAGGIEQFASLIPFILIFVVFYFLLIRPQQKRQKELQRQISQVKEGDVIVTAGGVKGKVLKVKDDSVIIQSEETTSEVLKPYVAQILAKK